MLYGLRDQIKVGAQPIAWSNDDFRQLGENTSLDQCLAEMCMAGYAGTEMGHKFPKDDEDLRPILDSHGLELVSGWHSAHILENTWVGELQRVAKHLNFLQYMGCSIAIVAECTHGLFSDPSKPLEKDYGEDLSVHNINMLGAVLNSMGDMALSRGMKLVYHPHIGSVIQNDSEVDRLMAATDPELVHLLPDTGHIALANGNVYDFFERHASRIGHVHLKNVRQNVADRVWSEGMSFEQAVIEGVFTVPGDDEGCIDYNRVFEILGSANYSGWLVVEAEQDPKKANPLEYFTLARKYIRDTAGI